MTTPHKAMLIQARDALTAAIDAPEPEPVAHIRQTYIVGLDGELLGVSEKKELRFGCGNDYAHCTPLYTHPLIRMPKARPNSPAAAADKAVADWSAA